MRLNALLKKQLAERHIADPVVREQESPTQESDSSLSEEGKEQHDHKESPVTIKISANTLVQLTSLLSTSAPRIVFDLAEPSSSSVAEQGDNDASGYERYGAEYHESQLNFNKLIEQLNKVSLQFDKEGEASPNSAKSINK